MSFSSICSSAPCGGRVLRLHGSDAKTIYKRATANDGAPFSLRFQYSDVFHASHNKKSIRKIIKILFEEILNMFFRTIKKSFE